MSCPAGMVCLTANIHIMLILLAAAAIVILVLPDKPADKPGPKRLDDKLREDWKKKIKMPRR